MGRRKKGENDEIAKEKLTDKIGEIIFSRGLLSFTMDEISRFFRVSKKTLYRFFPTKDELILHVSGVFASRIQKFVDKELEKIRTLGPDAFVPQVTELIGRFGSILLSVPASIFLDLESKSPMIFARIDHIRSSIVKNSFGRILEEGKRMGKIRPDIDSDIVSFIYSGMLRQIMSRQGLEPTHAPYEIYLTVIKILFQGVLTAEPKREFDPESLPRYSTENLWEKIRREDGGPEPDPTSTQD
jgi:AcrR family transcriptional regulator